MNKLLIVQPTYYRNKSDFSLYKTKHRTLTGLTLPYLAALTPREWDVELVDEQVRDIDFDASADMVAITAWTINSFRAYDIAREFRERGIPVIMGGPYIFSMATRRLNIVMPSGLARAKTFGRSCYATQREGIFNGSTARAHNTTSRGCPYRGMSC